MDLGLRQRNVIGREVPTNIDGRGFRPFAGSHAAMTEIATAPARIPARPFAGGSKVTTLEDAFSVLRDGDAVSFPHYYRNGGDRFLRAVIGELTRRSLKGIRLIGNAYFGDLDYLVEAVKADDGSILDVVRQVSAGSAPSGGSSSHSVA